MKPIALALIALLVAVSALAVALVDGPGSPRPPWELTPVAAQDDGALGRRVDGIEAELARLGEEIERLRPSLSETRSAGAPEEGSHSALETRIGALERRLDEQREAREKAPPSEKIEADAARKALRIADATARKDEIERWIRAARDLAATDEERLGALRRLRGRLLADGTDARVPVLPEMIRLAQTSENASDRADVWRQLSGVTDPSLLQPLLDALQHDPSANAREEAAETLADFLPNPIVRSALEFAAANDPSPQVRAQALESLSGGR